MSFQAVEFVLQQDIPSSPRKLLLIVIAHHVDRKTGTWTMKQGEIAREASMSLRQVKEHLPKLESDFRITRTIDRARDGSPEATEYTLVGYKEWMEQNQASAIPAFERAASDLRRQSAETRTSAKVRKPALKDDANPHLGLTETRTYIEVQSKVQSNNNHGDATASAACALNSLAEMAGVKSDIVVTTDQANEKIAKSRNGSSKSAPSYTSDFLEFWNAYPNKKGKANAAKTWRAMTIEDREAAKTAIRAYMSTDVCRRGYVQHGSTYLNSRTFDDYQTAQPVTVHANPEVSAELDVKAAAAAVELRSWGMANKRGWQTVRDFPQWVCDKLRGIVEPMTFDRMMSERMGAAA